MRARAKGHAGDWLAAALLIAALGLVAFFCITFLRVVMFWS